MFRGLLYKCGHRGEGIGRDDVHAFKGRGKRSLRGRGMSVKGGEVEDEENETVFAPVVGEGEVVEAEMESNQTWPADMQTMSSLTCIAVAPRRLLQDFPASAVAPALSASCSVLVPERRILAHAPVHTLRPVTLSFVDLLRSLSAMFGWLASSVPTQYLRRASPYSHVVALFGLLLGAEWCMRCLGD